MRWVKRLWNRRRTMRRRLAILEEKLDARGSRIDQLEATVAAYERAASGTPPGCAECTHLVGEHRYDGPCRREGCGCLEYQPATGD